MRAGLNGWYSVLCEQAREQRRDDEVTGVSWRRAENLHT